jgi:putative hydrolase of the HAD superfamily
VKARAVVFDRDGVLTYFDVPAATDYFRPLLPISIFELMNRWQAYGRVTGFPVTLPMEREFFQGFWQQLCQEFNLSPAQARVLYGTDYTRFISAYAEVPGVLAALRTRGIRIGLLSNFSLASLEPSLKAAGLDLWIDAAIAAHVMGTAKPEPDAYRAILAALNVEPQEVLFFDDEIACVEGARKLGIRSFLVDRTRTHDDPVRSILASLVHVPAIPFLNR